MWGDAARLCVWSWRIQEIPPFSPRTVHLLLLPCNVTVCRATSSLVDAALEHTRSKLLDALKNEMKAEMQSRQFATSPFSSDLAKAAGLDNILQLAKSVVSMQSVSHRVLYRLARLHHCLTLDGVLHKRASFLVGTVAKQMQECSSTDEGTNSSMSSSETSRSFPIPSASSTTRRQRCLVGSRWITSGRR